MKNLRNICMAMMMALAASPAFAVDTSKTYSSGILVMVFLAFCALIVVAQLMPSIMLLLGFIKGLVKGNSSQQAKNRG